MEWTGWLLLEMPKIVKTAAINTSGFSTNQKQFVTA